MGRGGRGGGHAHVSKTLIVIEYGLRFIFFLYTPTDGQTISLSPLYFDSVRARERTGASVKQERFALLPKVNHHNAPHSLFPPKARGQTNKSSFFLLFTVSITKTSPGDGRGESRQRPPPNTTSSQPNTRTPYCDRQHSINSNTTVRAEHVSQRGGYCGTLLTCAISFRSGTTIATARKSCFRLSGKLDLTSDEIIRAGRTDEPKSYETNSVLMTDVT